MATLRELGEAAGLTTEQVAGKAGIPTATLGAWEAGRGAPDAHQIGQLALVFGVTPTVVRAALALAEGEGAF